MESLVLLSALYRSRQNFALSHRTITVFAIIAKNTGLSDFEINYIADVPGLRTRRFGAQVFKLFVTIEIGSYAWSQVIMLQGKPLEFSYFHRFAANAVSVNTFLWKIEADRRTAIGDNHILFLLRSKCANLDLKFSWLNLLRTSFL